MRASSRVLIVVFTLMIMTVPITSASVLDRSILYLSSAPPEYVTNVRDSSLLLMALSSLYGKVENQSIVESSILELVDYLKTAQNPDGGWGGYYPNEVSNPLDTGYALAAIGGVKNLPLRALTFLAK